VLNQILLARTALDASLGVQSATGHASNIHRARKPGCDDRTQPQNPNQHNQVQKNIFQLFRVAFKLFRYS
jgi:hypothetical protein